MIIVDTIMAEGQIQVTGFTCIPKDKLPHTNLPQGKYLFADADVPEDFYRDYHRYTILPKNPPILIQNPNRM